MPRGRTFDKGSAVDAAIELFWSHGYEGVSMQDIAAATGVGNGSLYLAFGSKRDLFLEAFRTYCARRVALVDAAVGSADATPNDVLTRYFDAIVADCADDPARRGCLLVNTIAELGHEPPVADIAGETITRMERAVADALSTAGALDDERASLVRAAEQAVAMSQSLILLSRLGRSREALERAGRDGAETIARSLQAA